MYESMTPEMIDWQTEANRQLERARRIERQLEQLQEEQAAILPEDVGLKEWAAAQQKRIAEMEAEIAENDEMFELQRERTIEASREWQQATGQHNVWPDLGTLIDWLRGDRARLRGALERLRNGDDQPEYHSGIVDAGMDAWDANDNHAAAEHGWDICQELYGYWIEAEVEAALSATGQQEHPDTVRLDKFERWLRGEGMYSHFLLNGPHGDIDMCGEDYPADMNLIIAPDLRSAIDALKEAPRG